MLAVVDLHALLLRSIGNCRIFLIQPRSQVDRALFVRALQRLLWCKSPLLQILTDRPNRHRDAQLFMSFCTAWWVQGQKPDATAPWSSPRSSIESLVPGPRQVCVIGWAQAHASWIAALWLPPFIGLPPDGDGVLVASNDLDIPVALLPQANRLAA